MSNLEKKINLLVSLALAEDDATRKSIKEALAAEAKNANSVVSTCSTLREEVTRIIHDFGIPANIKGYNYVREAIILAVRNPDILEAITSELYPAVADKFNTSCTRVERAIRHAVEVAWQRGDLDTLQRFFGYTVSNTKGKPTNSEFVALIADHIRLKGQYNEVD